MQNIPSTNCTCAQLFAQHLADLKTKALRSPDLAGGYLQARAELLKIRNKHIDCCGPCLASEAQEAA
jgi:hypothetical protein